MITITIQTDNSVFDDGGARDREVARILRDIARRYAEGDLPTVVLGINGNTVGTVVDDDWE